MDRSPLLPIHEAAGGRLSPEGLVLTYGDVPAEYRAGLEGCMLLDATTRGALAVSGSEAEVFMHRITANAVKGLAPGEGRRNLLLSAKGKVEFDFDLGRTADGFTLSTTPGRAADLARALDMYLFTEDVQLAEVTERHAPLDLGGPRAAEVLEALLGSPPPSEMHSTVEATCGGHAVSVTHLPVAGSAGWRLDGGPEGAAALWEALLGAGARPAGLIAWDSLRVEAGRAVWGRDVDDTVYPQEARLEEAFDLEKGCYIGQEVVAKIDTYGGLNKCLCGLRIDGDDPLQAGTRLSREERGEWRDLGVVTSWAYSFALDCGLALGYVKRKHQARGTTFRLGDGPATATVVELPVRAGALPVSGEQP